MVKKTVSLLSVEFGILQNEDRQMRKRQTFLLTILSPENGSSSFCGRLKVISSGKTATFTSLEDLYRLIASEMDEELLQRLTQGDFSRDCSEKPFSAD
jgi:hypothetical protein